MKKILIPILIIVLIIIFIIIIKTNEKPDDEYVETDYYDTNARVEQSNGNSSLIVDNNIYRVIVDGKEIYSETDAVQAEILYNDPEFDMQMPEF